MTVRLLCVSALLAGALLACGESTRDKFVGACQTPDDCSDFTLLAPFSDSDNGAAIAFLQSTCSERQGTLSLHGCDPNNAAGSCTFFHAHFGDSILEQVSVLPATADPNAMSQECSQEGGYWETQVAAVPQ